MPNESNKVVLDLNRAEFLDVCLRLDPTELKRITSSLLKLRGLDWRTLYQHPGFQWERITDVTAPNGTPLYSLRISQKFRARAFRDGDYLRLISLHLDHDSAYN